MLKYFMQLVHMKELVSAVMEWSHSCCSACWEAQPQVPGCSFLRYQVRAHDCDLRSAVPPRRVRLPEEAHYTSEMAKLDIIPELAMLTLGALIQPATSLMPCQRLRLLRTSGTAGKASCLAFFSFCERMWRGLGFGLILFLSYQFPKLSPSQKQQGVGGLLCSCG